MVRHSDRHRGYNLRELTVGRVVAGQDIVDKIEGVKTGRNGFHDDVPLEAITIESATVVE